MIKFIFYCFPLKDGELIYVHLEKIENSFIKDKKLIYQTNLTFLLNCRVY